jgi:hypothetical protein
MDTISVGRDRVVALRIVVWVCAVTLAVTGCGGGSNDDSPSPPAPASAASTVAGAASGSGLTPRPDLPALVKGELAACLPLCATGRDVPGELPLGTYQTRWFFGGYMTLGFERAWTGLEDSTGELKIAPATDSEYGVGFALDLYPVRSGKRVNGVPMTAAGLLEWLGGNPNLEVSKSTATSIGKLPAMAVDIGLSKAAVNDDPGCPARACVNFLGFPQWDHANGIAGDDVYRLYLADVRYSGTDHVFSVTVEGRDRTHLGGIVPAVEQVLGTVEVPARPR